MLLLPGLNYNMYCRIIKGSTVKRNKNVFLTSAIPFFVDSNAQH